MKRVSVVLHGHFYQPPREDPRSDQVPREPSAAPYHDWNERILAECYRPVTEARIMDAEHRVRDVVNALEWMSWDAGPTLLRWLAREAPITYRAFLEADARSRARLGFGNAMAAPYHHVILPLASRRDKITEVRWGIADFRRRFGREPEGMWLPETAVDTETLDVLATEGIRFTVLAPSQVERSPRGGRPGRVRVGGGRSIAVFTYDGPLSHGIAFGPLLEDADRWIRTVSDAAAGPEARLVSMATDGETFGHHHRWADMALAATLSGLAHAPRLHVENFASFLAREPVTEDVVLVEPTSWSCAHGVDRWRLECGCKMAPHVPSRQTWRTVLREALEELAEDLHGLFEREGSKVFDDPWATRDAYGQVLDAGEAARGGFMADQAREGADAERLDRGLSLLELERDALRMFTSCGWFFDDLAGLEPLQVLRYAAHALDLAGPAAAGWEDRLRRRLAGASSNDPEAGDGRRLWDERIRADAAEPPPALVAQGPTPVEPARGTHRVQGGRATSAVRRFLRAPGTDAAREILELVEHPGAVPEQEMRAARTLFAGGISSGPEAPAPPVVAVAEALGFGPAFFRPRSVGGVAPVRFVFGLHLHQPTGNFDHVFQSHTDDVYLPLLERLAERAFMPITLHVSGPLLDWLERHGHAFLDVTGRLASEGKVELLLSGFDEPVLPALSRVERAEQIAWMRDWLGARFGVAPTGLWLTERVWEPDLVEDLADAGIEYALVDDRHFLVAGHERGNLFRPHRTESGGRRLSLLSIDERLRYLVPFRPPSETVEYLRALRAADRATAVLVDDGEKFGGWPGTADWVWGSGWLDRFLDAMAEAADEGVVELATAGDVVRSVPPEGPTYLPSASYREMEAWSLPPAATLDLEALEGALAAAGLPESATRFVRGGHWRNFFAMYPESSRMHAKAQRLSVLCRAKGDPFEARRAIGRAQCNDAYWHGVFGGLYLRHLRGAIWESLLEGERMLRAGQGLEVEIADVDGDGLAEYSIHSEAFACVVNPYRGGAITELSRFAEGMNLADVLTRRWESYHRGGPTPPEDGADAEAGDVAEPRDGMPSIHEMEEGVRFRTLPPFDEDDRALTVERVLTADLSEETYALGDYEPIRSWARAPMESAHARTNRSVEIDLTARSMGGLSKTIRLSREGDLEITYRWDPASFPADARFAPELSLAADLAPELEPPTETWRYEIRSVSRSERGTEETVQGWSVTPLWPARLGEARVRIPAGPPKG
jgi:alpha-amylase/alpha-mannosidase (GH57 family)